jgi:hypothetical protein
VVVGLSMFLLCGCVLCAVCAVAVFGLLTALYDMCLLAVWESVVSGDSA